jgi:hypothetical protein
MRLISLAAGRTPAPKSLMDLLAGAVIDGLNVDPEGSEEALAEHLFAR